MLGARAKRVQDTVGAAGGGSAWGTCIGFAQRIVSYRVWVLSALFCLKHATS